MRHIITCMLMLTLANFSIRAAEPADSLTCDSLCAPAPSKSGGFIEKIKNYFKESNVSRRHEGMDFSIIGGPHYSSDTKLGLGIVAAGQYYSTGLADTITDMSNISLVGDITTGGFYKIGIHGNHFTPQNRWRLDYYVDFCSFLRKFWGIGYEAGQHVNSFEKFKELRVKVKFQALWRASGNFYLGPCTEFTHYKANDVKENYRWDGQSLSTYSTSVGFAASYDSRDNLTATQSGWLAALHQGFSPRFLGNKYSYSFTEITAMGFWKGWKDAVICTRLHAQYNYGNVPWGMMATFGGSDIMRGYYEGRYRDKCEMDVTLELRQHVWRRNGIVCWIGAGAVAPRPSKFALRKILPNGGIGYRWEFKKRTNVRLDFGVGRGETSFIFNINEAF